MKEVLLAASAAVLIPGLLILPDVQRASAQGAAPADTCLGAYPYPSGLIPQDVCAEMDAQLAKIDQTEQQTLQYAKSLPVNIGTRLLQIRTLGKLLLYDRNYSVNRKEACTSCH